MTDFKRDFSAGVPLQITQHINRMVAGNLLAVGGSLHDVLLRLFIPNLLAANGSYIVWDEHGEIYHRTEGAMKDMGYTVYVVDDDSRCGYSSCLDLFIRKPNLFKNDRVVIYVLKERMGDSMMFMSKLKADDHHMLYGQHLTMITSDSSLHLELPWMELFFPRMLLDLNPSYVSTVVHVETLDSFSKEDLSVLMGECRYKLFLDNSSGISYLNRIIPVFASCEDVSFSDLREGIAKKCTNAPDVKVLEEFRDMEEGDCLFVEDERTFVFDKVRDEANVPETKHQEEPLLIRRTFPVLLTAVAAGVLIAAIEKKRS